jgi:hypothetical protein
MLGVSLDAEKLLVPVIAAFYLKDCLLLLRSDEAVLVRSGLGRWRAGFGLPYYKLRGREPYLCNPLLPHEPVFRMRWAMTPADSGSAWNAAVPTALRALQPAVILMALLLLVGIPTALLGHLGKSVLVLLIGALYAVILISMAWVVRRRKELGLNSKACVVLASEVLLCPPYAVNLVRKLSLRARPAGDFVLTAQRLLSPAKDASVQRACAERVALQLELVDEQSPMAASLRAAHQRFTARASCDER